MLKCFEINGFEVTLQAPYVFDMSLNMKLINKFALSEANEEESLQVFKMMFANCYFTDQEGNKYHFTSRSVFNKVFMSEGKVFEDCLQELTKSSGMESLNTNES